MRGCLKAAAAFGLVAMLAGPAFAQGRGGMGMGMGQGPVGLLGNPSVQKELKLDDTQVEKAKALSASTREQMMGLRDQLTDLQGQERMTKQQELMKPITEEAMKTAKGFLKAEQLARLTQIELQQRGINALSDPAIAKKLSVTDEQATKVKALLSDMQAENQKIREEAGQDFQSAMPKMQAVRKETTTKVMALMNDDQKKTWKEMTGEPFEVVMQPRPAR